LPSAKHFISNARDGVQVLLASLFTLESSNTPLYGRPLAQLPPPTTLLPRSKPLPEPKSPTKWEKFAAAKGVQKKVREKKVWGSIGGEDGKEKEQWITEVPPNAGV
jgi:regulator of ribosome biosynthesis